jgi:hypothetical protein
MVPMTGVPGTLEPPLGQKYLCEALRLENPPIWSLPPVESGAMSTYTQRSSA